MCQDRRAYDDLPFSHELLSIDAARAMRGRNGTCSSFYRHKVVVISEKTLYSLSIPLNFPRRQLYLAPPDKYAYAQWTSDSRPT
jgi:hypothetical protein